MTKTCTRCHTEKPIDCFRRARNRPGGRKPHCRDCEKKTQPTRCLDRLARMKD